MITRLHCVYDLDQRTWRIARYKFVYLHTCPMCHHLWDMYNRKVHHDICHHLWNIHNKMCMNLSWHLKWANVNYKYGDWKVTHDILYNGNSNVYPVSYHLWNIHNQNVQDLDLWNGLRWNINMSIESSFYMMTIVMLALSVTIYEIFAI